MSAKLEMLKERLDKHLASRATIHPVKLGEITIEVDASNYFDVMKTLRDEADLGFEELIDLCGVDYSEYGNGRHKGNRFAAVVHLLSIAHNWRVRVRCFATDDHFPTLPSLTSLWASVDWFEREAFDLFGIVFLGHEDLRRLLTDYGFIGHPFRKDFPISGYVEMRYDPELQRLVYQPVTIEPRENTPRVVREPGYGDTENA